MIYEFLAKNAVRIGVAIAGLLAVWWLYQFVTAAPKAEAKLGRNQAEAALQAGQDAVSVVGKAGEREATIAETTRTNEVEIRNAEGADAPVAAPARDAGLASLCRRASYRSDPKCVQRVNP